MDLVTWNPFRDFDGFFERYGSVSPAERPVAGDRWRPAVDIFETDSSYVIELDLPAVSTDDVSVVVNEGVLAISGERKVEKPAEGRAHLVERRTGKFERRFRLPEEANDTEITATARNGVLSVVIAKSEQERPRTIEVKVH